MGADYRGAAAEPRGRRLAELPAHLRRDRVQPAGPDKPRQRRRPAPRVGVVDARQQPLGADAHRGQRADVRVGGQRPGDRLRRGVGRRRVGAHPQLPRGHRAVAGPGPAPRGVGAGRHRLLGDGRRGAGRPRRADRRAALGGEHRRLLDRPRAQPSRPHRRRQGGAGLRGRRPERARPGGGPRRRDRRAPVDHLHGAAAGRAGLRDVDRARGAAPGRPDLEHHQLRPRAGARLPRHGAADAVGVDPARPRRRPLHELDPRPGHRHRRDRVVLPGGAGRQLGPRRDPREHARRPRHQRRRAQGADRDEQDRLGSGARPRDRAASSTRSAPATTTSSRGGRTTAAPSTTPPRYRPWTTSTRTRSSRCAPTSTAPGT